MLNFIETLGDRVRWATDLFLLDQLLPFLCSTCACENIVFKSFSRLVKAFWCFGVVLVGPSGLAWDGHRMACSACLFSTHVYSFVFFSIVGTSLDMSQRIFLTLFVEFCCLRHCTAQKYA